MKKRMMKVLAIALIMVNMLAVPVYAMEKSYSMVQPRFNNMGACTLSIGFDDNYIGYFDFTVAPYQHCTGFSGAMKLWDASGNMLKSWAITDQEEPYGVEKTYQCTYGATYTVTFDGYVYGANTMYDEVHISVSDTCD